MIRRWWIYQHERFPILAHGPLIAAYSFSAVSFSSFLRGETLIPSLGSLLVAFLSTFLFFLQLRIADEFKDQAEDRVYRPYRPVPRGLVSLGELKAVSIASALLQSGIALWLEPFLMSLLVIVWLYQALMIREFFVSAWLKRHPFTYMWTHMLILPFISLYATACDWLASGSLFPEGLTWFLLLSFFNGFVIEIGRKIRAPEAEEKGVETYSALWGPRNAVVAWLASMTLTAITAFLAGKQILIAPSLAALLSIPLIGAAVISWQFVMEPISKNSRLLQPMSGLWTVLLYLGLGLFPWLFKGS